MYNPAFSPRSDMLGRLGEENNFVAPYHENLKIALKTYLPEDKIDEAAKVLGKLGHQVYCAPGFVLVKHGFGCFTGKDQKKIY